MKEVDAHIDYLLPLLLPSVQLIQRFLVLRLNGVAALKHALGTDKHIKRETETLVSLFVIKQLTYLQAIHKRFSLLIGPNDAVCCNIT